MRQQLSQFAVLAILQLALSGVVEGSSTTASTSTTTADTTAASTEAVAGGGSSSGDSDYVYKGCGHAPYTESRELGLEEKIVSGTPAAHGRYPFLATVIPAGYLCGGTLYNERTVITAAHCLTHITPPYAGQIKVVLGGVDLFDPSESGEQTIDVKYAVLHKEYGKHQQSYDIAVLQLETPVKYTKWVQPICLPSKKEVDGETTIPMGWGLTSESGQFSQNLLEAKVPVINNQDCLKMSGYPLDDTQLCAGFQQGEIDACQGDSGGPLVKRRNGLFELIGVVSYGAGCARPDHPGVYADAYYFKKWITDNAF